MTVCKQRFEHSLSGYVRYIQVPIIIIIIIIIMAKACLYFYSMLLQSLHQTWALSHITNDQKKNLDM